MGEIDAAGEMMTGALLGRAVEGHSGGGHGHATMCLNCGTALLGAHCHQCGQAGHVHRSLGAIGHEILHGVFHFEGKLWRTLPMLAWRPGELTRRFVAGERARFVSPMAIFLFSIFAMFAVFSWAGLSAPSDLSGVNAAPLAAIEYDRKDTIEERRQAIERRDDPDSSAKRRAKAVSQIAESDAHLSDLDAATKELKSKDMHITTSLSGWSAVDHGIEKWKKNPSLMLYKLQSTGYKFSWLLIPLSVPFLWLLFFWKRQYKLYDHAVFVTYSIAFMSLLFIALTVFSKAGLSRDMVAMASMLLPLVHIARQLKQAYRLRWWSAIARTIVLCFFIVIILLLFLLILLLLGVTG